MNAPIPPRALLLTSLQLDDARLLLECDVELFIGSGPGGQHRNKTESAVRLRHRPSGIVAIAAERRSQFQNRNRALRRLRQKLAEAAFVPRPRKATQPTRASQERRLAHKKLASAQKRLRSEKIDF